MKHLSEDELIELYYAEDTSGSNAHLKACRECSRRYAELTRSLEEIQLAAVPLRGADYGERVWETLRPQLSPYEKKSARWRGWADWRAAAMAFGCAIVLAMAFIGGRYWERNNTTKKANV